MRAAAETRAAIDLVLLGYRPGALHAATRRQLRTLVVDERAPSAAARRRAAAWVRVAPDAEDAVVLEGIREALGEARPSCVISAGERGVLVAAAVREAFGLAGIDRATALRARDKAEMKRAARAAGVPCADWLTLEEAADADEIAERLGYPVVLKHRRGAGSRGLVITEDRAEVEAFLRSLPGTERASWMAERKITGIEMSLESFVLDGEILFTNPTEYLVPTFANIAPAALPHDELEAILALNAQTLRALGIQRGMTHLELFRTPDGPVFGEVAVRPPGGRIMRILRRSYGFDPWEALLAIEGGERFAFPKQAKGASGVWMLHPGAGRVRHVRGLAAARRLVGVRKLVCRVRAGSEIGRRESTGADVGWIEVRGASRDQVAERLGAAYDLLRIEMDPTPT